MSTDGFIIETYCLSCWARYQKLVRIPNSRIYCNKRCGSKFSYHLRNGDITYDEDGWPIIERYIEKHCKYCMARYQKKVPVPVHKMFCNSQCRSGFGYHERNGNITYENGVAVIRLKTTKHKESPKTALASTAEADQKQEKRVTKDEAWDAKVKSMVDKDGNFKKPITPKPIYDRKLTDDWDIRNGWPVGQHSSNIQVRKWIQRQ